MVMSVPTLDQIAEDPVLAQGLPPAATRDLVLRCIIALAALMPSMSGQHAEVEGKIELLSLEEAASRLRMPLTTLRGRANTEPYRSLRGSNGTRYVCFRSDLLEAFIRGKTLGPSAPNLATARRRKGHEGPAQLPSTSSIGKGNGAAS
jgi:hypothetical protein